MKLQLYINRAYSQIISQSQDQITGNIDMSVIPTEETLKYINQARTKPSEFAKYVKQQMDSFIDQMTLPLSHKCNEKTCEGLKAWEEAYSFLMKQKPLPPYTLSQGLTLAAEDHAIDMATTGSFDHIGSNGTLHGARIKKRCDNALGSSAQNLGSDYQIEDRNNALKTILGLVIDDGCQYRGHRTSIFSKEYKYVGICSRVQGDKVITVIDYHANKVTVRDGTKNTNNVGMELKYKQSKQQTSGGSNNSIGVTKENGESSSGNKEHTEKVGAGNVGGKKGGFQESGPGDKGPGKAEGNKGGKHGGLQESGPGNKGPMAKVGGGNLGGNQGGFQASTNSNQGNSGGRTILSKSTKTKTSTVNGVTTVVKTTKLTYSDGSMEQQIQETIN